MSLSGRVILQANEGARWLVFENPVEIYSATQLDEVQPQLRKAAKAIEQDSLYAAGLICYEAAPAFDQALETHEPGVLPLLWFGLYEQPREISGPDRFEDYDIGGWIPEIDRADYTEACEYIKEKIARGQTYQVNYTFRQRTEFRGDPRTLFADLANAQQSKYCTFIDLGRFVICSASPELFFAQNGKRLFSRPMKGTAGRGVTLEDDKEQAEWLYHSAKNRAENVMIVDMIRNDLGRISDIGSVTVPRLFKLERYPTIWQMTSSVESRSTATLPEIMAALFPCASITGAPKVSTMNIIAEIERSPRGIYTGCLGYVGPKGEAQFNVGIRTVTIDKERQTAEYGVGGGIVWDSNIEEEFQECLTKSLILSKRWPEFRLLETILWRPVEGFFLLELHLERMINSASYFDFKANQQELERCLLELEAGFTSKPQKIRLLLDPHGEIEVESEPIDHNIEGKITRLGLAKDPVSSDNVFLYHKTTNRTVYERALQNIGSLDDVLLWNERGEVTEATTANVVLKEGNQLATPVLGSGLLAGTFRQQLIDEGRIVEQTIMIDELHNYEEIFLINSVRKWRQARLFEADRALNPFALPG